ncbi:hypothetical protein UFOVP1165_57 [uncultured Caudovirales phage]|uniref:Uncharacterized protein n=1 Tax=uncultured Caudovirales phage TaxID=2100421 RepID=A0A6J5R8Y5_9CAUD|nr:hypothetical protein UFOVP1165_57 [uncultured Caudovirales phage]
MKRTYRLIDGQWTEIVRNRSQSVAPYVQPDYPDYESPVDGRVVHGKKGRRYDLERTQSRPWEGREAEQKEVDRHNAYQEQKMDRRLEETTRRTLAQMHPAKRRILGA